jgi:hypothetical protein
MKLQIGHCRQYSRVGISLFHLHERTWSCVLVVCGPVHAGVPKLAGLQDLSLTYGPHELLLSRTRVAHNPDRPFEHYGVQEAFMTFAAGFPRHSGPEQTLQKTVCVAQAGNWSWRVSGICCVVFVSISTIQSVL